MAIWPIPSTSALFYILLLPRQNSRAKCFQWAQTFLFLSYVKWRREPWQGVNYGLWIYITVGQQEFSSNLNTAIKSQYLDLMNFYNCSISLSIILIVQPYNVSCLKKNIKMLRLIICNKPCHLIASSRMICEALRWNTCWTSFQMENPKEVKR